MVSGVPPEALHVARKRLTLLQSVGAGGAETAASSAAYLQQQMAAMVGDLRSKMDMMASLQSRLEAMQNAQAALEEENKQLRAGGAVRRNPRAGASASMEAEDDEDEQDKFDRLAREGYAASRAAILETLSHGRMPSGEQYNERDVHMYRLSDVDVQAEYAWYTQIYLADETAAAVRGMAEMTLIKLGEIVDLPQAKRAKMIERQAEEAKRAKEAREREESRSATERAEKQRQTGMNQQAYAECRALWEPLHPLDATKSTAALSEADRALSKRVSNRAELRLVLTSAEDVKRMPPGSFVAMGTSGLQPTELRAVLHALHVAGPTGSGALRFIGMLQARVADLTDFEPSSSTPKPIEATSPRDATSPSATGPAPPASTLAPAPPPAPPPPAPAPRVPPPLRSLSSAASTGTSGSHNELLAAISGGSARARLRSASARSISASSGSTTSGALSSDVDGGDGFSRSAALMDEIKRKASARSLRQGAETQ